MPPSRGKALLSSPSWPLLLLLLLLHISTWLPRAAAQGKSAADYFVSFLPGAPEPLLKMWAGHIEVTPEHHGNMFFWFYKNRHIANRQRTVIWLNGGPGCSSMDGALMEIGPYRVNENGTLRYNDGSWDEFANILFIDNPVGTGFSYVDSDSYLHELDEMADQMIVFLEQWFKLFPEYVKDDLYIAGESYAGQHIPYVAKAIVDRNARAQERDRWNLSGLLIGNGWISGPEQYLSYAPLAYETGLLKPGSPADQNVRAQERECQKMLDMGASENIDVGACDAILRVILSETKRGNGCVNMYDVRLTDSYPSCGMSWPPDLEFLTPYLRRKDVTAALHINPDKRTGWIECNNQVSAQFRALNSKPSKELLPALLEQMPVLLFSGDQDLICNHIGIERVIQRLTWNGAMGMQIYAGITAPIRDWTVDNEPAGTWQTARNLTYIKVFNSSHMVPFDYPRRTRDMLDRFMGVDIASIGGTPMNSRLDGEPGLETSVGGHPNSTAAKEEEVDKLEAATWAAYRRSAEAALVVVVFAASLWAFFVWQDRRRRRLGYRGLLGGDPDDGYGGSGLGLDSISLRSKQSREDHDIEAAADFDESELDDMSRKKGYHKSLQREDFVVHEGDDDDDDGDDDDDDEEGYDSGIANDGVGNNGNHHGRGRVRGRGHGQGYQKGSA